MWNPGTDLHLDVDGLTPLSESLPIDTVITWAWNELVDGPNPMPPVATSYSAIWTSSRVPPAVSLTILPMAGGVRVQGPNVEGLAIINVEYLLDRVPGAVDNWTDLPPEAQQVTKYDAQEINLVDATFNVTVTRSDGYSDLTQGFTIHGLVNYTTGRDTLIEQVDLRR